MESQLRGDCTDSGSGPLLAGQNWPQQPLVAGPSLRSAHANKEALAYSWFVFQRGILQISSHERLARTCRGQDIVVLEERPVGAAAGHHGAWWPVCF